MGVTDFIVPALLGDKSAQKKCTDGGSILPCPCCGSENIGYQTSFGDYDYGWGGFRCYDCNLEQGYNFETEEEALERWNTRPVPPIFKKLRRVKNK